MFHWTSGKLVIGVATALLLFSAAQPAPADAARRAATLTVSTAARIASAGPGAVTMNVKASGYDPSTLGVANWCEIDGNLATSQFSGIQWTSLGDPATGTVSFELAAGVTSCTAYVFQYPSVRTPLKGTSVTY